MSSNGRLYVKIPGKMTHELPPLLVRNSFHEMPTDLEAAMLEAEEMLPEVDMDDSLLERRKLDLALMLTEQHRGLLALWLWGDSIVQWIRQCEDTFQSVSVLRNLLRPDVWPHVSRSSFVFLLADKSVLRPGVALNTAVGLRLMFRQPPPIDCLSGEFLICLKESTLDSAYRAWTNMGSGIPTLLPHRRFHFDVLDTDVQLL
jgi:hypothetical protein